MTQKNSQNHKWLFGHIPTAFSYFSFIFFLVLTGCSSGNKATNTTSGGSPAGVPAPIWNQTEYVFQNKTNAQISIIEPGKSKIVLNINECVYMEQLTFYLAYRQIAKTGVGLICGNPCVDDPYKHCKHVKCSDKLLVAHKAGYKNFKRDEKSEAPYLEIYNIVNTDQIFEAAMASPIPADSSQKAHWKGRCTSSAKGTGNSPPTKN